MKDGIINKVDPFEVVHTTYSARPAFVNLERYLELDLYLPSFLSCGV